MAQTSLRFHLHPTSLAEWSLHFLELGTGPYPTTLVLQKISTCPSMIGQGHLNVNNGEPTGPPGAGSEKPIRLLNFLSKKRSQHASP